MISSEFPPGPGGIGTHAWQLCKEFHRLGHEVTVMTPQDYADERQIQAFNAKQPFAMGRLSSMQGAVRGTIGRWRMVVKETRRFQPDMLIGTGDRMAYLTAGLAKWCGIPWIAVEHGRWPSVWETAIKKRAFSVANGTVCVSQYSLDRLLEMGTKPRQSIVIHNGADHEVYRLLPPSEVEAVRRELSPSDGRWFMTVGTLSDRKAQDTVIRALPDILKHIPNAQYLCVGLPNIKDRLLALADELGVRKHVHLAGALPTGQVVGLLNAVELFVLNSRRTADEWEGFGVAVVEAALCGKAAVVSKDSGLAEAIVDGVTGVGVPQNNPSATAAAIVGMLGDPEKCRKMGETARAQAIAGRTWSQAAEKYVTFLRRCHPNAPADMEAGASAAAR